MSAERVVSIEEYRNVAREINKEHRLARENAESAIQHAVRCGELLVAQKEAMKHGKFMLWVEEQCEFKYPTAALYMRAFGQSSKGLKLSSLTKLLADPETSSQPRKGAARKNTIGWIKATEIAYAATYGEPLPPGFTENTLRTTRTDVGRQKHGDNENARARVERELGRPIKSRLRLPRTGSPEAQAIADAIYRLHTAGNAEKVATDSAALSKAARDELSEKAQERFDRLLKRATDAEIRSLHAQFDREVAQHVEKRLAEAERDMEQRRARLDALEEELNERAERIRLQESSVDQHMTMEEYNIIRGCLHPDKQTPDRFAKFNRALEIFLRLEKTVNPRLSIAVKRQRGWAPNPFRKN